MVTFNALPDQLQQLVRSFIRSSENQTPKLIVSRDLITYNYKFFKNCFDLDDNQIFYALKANSDPAIIRTIRDMNAGFEIASSGELIHVNDK